MNNDTIKGKWKQIEGKAKQKWAKLGDTDFALLAEGKTEEFAGILQAKAGASKEEAKKQIREFEESCGCSSSGSKAA